MCNVIFTINVLSKIYWSETAKKPAGKSESKFLFQKETHSFLNVKYIYTQNTGS